MKVSVLIPSFNYGRFIEEAIESVLSQSFKDFELIVVDNNSSDNTKEILEAYLKTDSRISYYCNEKNIGAQANFNQALLLARGDYIKFLNADDKLHTECLEKFVEVLDNNADVSLVTSKRILFGEKTSLFTPPFTGKVDGFDAIFHALKSKNWIGEPTTVMFRRKNLNLGLFDISLLMFADLDMWLRQLQVGDLYIVDEVLSYFRIHKEQATVYLSDSLDKELFTWIQRHTYTQYSLINNRFGIDFFKERSQETLKLLEKRHKKAHGFLFKKTIYKKRIKEIFRGYNLFLHVRFFLSRFRKKLKGEK